MAYILPRKPGLFRYSAWDAVPVLAAFIHLAYLLSIFFVFTHVHMNWQVKVPVMALMGIVYAFSISWNINGISHNFIHNKYFNSNLLNRLFSILESIDNLFSQVMYDHVHRRHHMGNADKPGSDGQTVDWISIYKHGHDGKAEPMWTYFLMTFWRDDPKRTFHEIKKHNAYEARWGLVEMAITGIIMATAFFLNWKFMLYFMPFWYLGHSLSNLNGYYEHLGGNPEVPIAWGVSSYHRLYNLVWFNNGFHAEHHYRPRAHWTRMKELHETTAEEQKKAGVRVIKPPHVFGFLDKDLCDEPLVPLEKLRDVSGNNKELLVNSDELGDYNDDIRIYGETAINRSQQDAVQSTS